MIAVLAAGATPAIESADTTVSRLVVLDDMAVAVAVAAVAMAAISPSILSWGSALRTALSAADKRPAAIVVAAVILAGVPLSFVTVPPVAVGMNPRFDYPPVPVTLAALPALSENAAST